MSELTYRTYRRSVKRADYPQDTAGGGVINFLIPWGPAVPQLLPRELPLPRTPIGVRNRDTYLAITPRVEAMWATAVGIATTKMAALAWDITSEVTLRSARAQELLLNADGGAGWVAFIQKHIKAYTCTGNGAFFEIERETQAYGSRVRGIHHLSSLRCRRTGNVERPVVYEDRFGREHELRWWEVVSIADSPDEDEECYGAGQCAAERAYQQIAKLAAIERYVYEKVSGDRILGIHIVNGISPLQLEDALRSADDAQAAKGFAVYKGGVIIPTLKADSELSIVTIPLAELPDGFSPQEERDRADLIYANALGLDPQDLKPISNQQLGAGAQSAILNDKAKGRGLAAWRQAFTHALNELALDDKTTFVFTERDYSDQLKEAEVTTARATAIKTLVDAQILTPGQGLQILVDQDEIPKAFLPQDDTPGDVLSDTEKPVTAEATAAAAAALPSPQVPISAPGLPLAAKAALDDEADALIDTELDAALALVARVTRRL